jgi:biotin operon repressor
MAYEDYRMRMERLQNLIKHECTGKPDELAKKLEISRRTLFKDLSTLRDAIGITYDRYRGTYYYDEK